MGQVDLRIGQLGKATDWYNVKLTYFNFATCKKHKKGYALKVSVQNAPHNKCIK